MRNSLRDSIVTVGKHSLGLNRFMLMCLNWKNELNLIKEIEGTRNA